MHALIGSFPLSLASNQHQRLEHEGRFIQGLVQFRRFIVILQRAAMKFKRMNALLELRQSRRIPDTCRHFTPHQA